MIKVEAIKDFTLGRYNELKNIVRANGIEEIGMLRSGDTFECSQELYEYLIGNNPKKEIVVKLIEVIPEAKVEENVKPLEEEKIEEVAKAIIKNVKKVKKTSKK